MTDLQGVLQDETLISLVWDKGYIENVLNEMLILFKRQNKKIDEMEDKLQTYARITDVKKLENGLNSFKDKMSEEMTDVNSQIEGIKSNAKTVFLNLKEYVESQTLNTLAETKRMLLTEIENFSPHLRSPATEDPLKDKITELEEKINNLAGEINSKTVEFQKDLDKATKDKPPQPSQSLSDRVYSLENEMFRVDNMERDLNSLLLQFPAVTKRLERKINECMGVVESMPIQSSRNVSQNYLQQPAPLPKQMQTSNPKFTVPPGSPIVSSSPQRSSSDLPNLNEFDLVRSIPDIKVPDMSVLEQTPSPESEQASEAELNLSPIALDKVRTEDKIEVFEPLPSPPQPTPGDADRKLRKPNSKDTFEINPDTKGNVVHVVETHTYKTELASSVRVVSEIEWVKQMITQHHEALRKLQIGVRGQQDSFDQVADSFNRMNIANNAKFSQVSQQIMTNKAESEAARKTLQAQLNQQQQRIVSLSAARFETPAAQEPLDLPSAQTSSRATSKPSGRIVAGSTAQAVPQPQAQSSARASSGNRKRVTLLPPLSASVSLSHEKSEYGLDLKEESPLPSPPGGERAPEKTTRTFTFMTTHFDALLPTSQQNVVVSTINTVPAYKRNIATVHLVSQMDHPTNRSKKSDKIEGGVHIGGVVESDDESESSLETPPSGYERERGTEKRYGDRQIRIAHHRRRPQTSMEVDGITQLSQELIEEKVGKEARAVVGELAIQVRESVEEQLRGMRKEVDGVITLVDNKIDREFVERIFNKFREMLSELNEKIDNLQCSFLDWVTRDELEMVLQRFMGMINEAGDSAATHSKFNCLLCGRPRAHLAGMITDLPMPSGPQSQNPSPGKKSGVRTSVNTAANTRGNTRNRPRTDLGDKPRDVVTLITS